VHGSIYCLENSSIKLANLFTHGQTIPMCQGTTILCPVKPDIAGAPLPTTFESESSIAVNTCLATSNRTTRKISCWLKYHRENLSHAHYLRPFDHRNEWIDGLRELAENDTLVAHAVAAFTALLYSILQDPTAREEANRFYNTAKNRADEVRKISTVNKTALLVVLLQLSIYEAPISFSVH